MTALQRPVLHHTTAHRRVPLQLVGATQDREVRQADFVRVPVDDGGKAEVVGRDATLADLQLEVAAVVDFRPLQLAVGADQEAAGVVGFGEGDVLAVRAGAGDGGAGEFDADRAGSRRHVVGVVVQPDEVAHPVGVRVAGDHDVVADVVGVQGLEGSVSIGLVPVPGVVVQRVGVAVRGRFVQAGEDGLAADDTPGGLALGRRHELGVEPIFLATAHHSSASVIGDLVNVVGVPV